MPVGRSHTKIQPARFEECPRLITLSDSKKAEGELKFSWSLKLWRIRVKPESTPIDYSGKNCQLSLERGCIPSLPYNWIWKSNEIWFDQRKEKSSHYGIVDYNDYRWLQYFLAIQFVFTSSRPFNSQTYRNCWEKAGRSHHSCIQWRRAPGEGSGKGLKHFGTISPKHTSIAAAWFQAPPQLKQQESAGYGSPGPCLPSDASKHQSESESKMI